MDKDFLIASQFLTLLDTEQRWFTLAEIEKKLGVSDKTISKISEGISKQLPSGIKIEVSRGKGVFLQRDRRNKTVSEVISTMFKQTTFFRLMDLLFTDGGRLTLEELAEEMFMSSSSLKKLIVQLNNHVLKPYNLRITYSSPSMKGNEINIRYFYWKLYGDAYEFAGWPFTKVNFDVINQLISNIEEEKNIVYFINSKRRLSFLVAIVLERVNKGESVTISERNYPWKQGMFYFSMTNLAKKLQQMFAIELSQSEIFFMQSLFSTSQYNYYDHSIMVKVKEAERSKNKLEHQMVERFLSLLLKVYPNLNMNERFLWEIDEFFDKLLIDNAIPELMLNSNNNLNTYVQKECQQNYQEVQICLQEWNTAYPAVTYNDFHLTKLTLLVSSSLHYKSKKAFLVIGEEFSIQHYVAKLIKKEIGDELTINTSIMKGLTDEIVQQHNIDFVISNIPVTLKTVPVVIISTIPTKRDFDNIRKELLL